MKKCILLMLFIFIVFAASSQQQSKFQKSLTKEDYKNYFMTDIQAVNLGINFPLFDTIQLVCILPTQETNKDLMKVANDYYTNYINSFYPNLKYIKYKIVTDKEALQTDLSDCSIRTFGTKSGNLWTKWFLSQMTDFPLKIYNDSVVADRCYPGNTLHVYAVWFNPFNIKQGVILNILQNIEHFEFPTGRDVTQFQIFDGDDNISKTYYYHLIEGNWTISDKRDKLLEYKIDVGNDLGAQRMKVPAYNNLSSSINTFKQGVNPNAPKIINSIPEFGDCNVDPELKEIVLKFDQDMANGMSLINIPNMPEKNGQPKWIDKRTYSIPVKLYPNKLYSLAFNNSKFQNFTNTSGTPLNPDELHFQTMPVSYENLNKKAYKDFIEFFPKEYSYASLKGINWQSILEENRAELENAKTDTEFALKLIKVLRIAEDPHLWVEVEGQRFETGKLKLVEYNYGSKQFFSQLQNKKVSDGFLSISGVIDSIGYISIRDWNTDFNKLTFKSWGDSGNQEISAEDVLKDLFKFHNLIVDVRENSGGNESYAKEFASYFVKDTVPYEKVVSFSYKSGLFDNENLKKLFPNEKKLNYTGNIYVLCGPSVMSSSESFILMMKQVPNTKIVGMKTYGSSGNPIPHKLSNGVIIYLPSWQAYTLDGILIEKNGIQPDVEIKTSKKDFEDKDLLLEQVLIMKQQKTN